MELEIVDPQAALVSSDVRLPEDRIRQVEDRLPYRDGLQSITSSSTALVVSVISLRIGFVIIY